MKAGLAALSFAVYLSVLPLSASAQSCVDVALVMALDGSGSVTATEYRFQQDAVASALRHPEVLKTIEQAGTVAITVIKWGTAEQSTHETPWVVIHNAQDAEQLARKVETMPRRVWGNTGLGAAMARSLVKFEELSMCAERMIVNISGDGRDTSWKPKQSTKPTPAAQKRLAAERNVTINALAISREEPDLLQYYSQHVITGPGAFAMEIPDYASYAAAIRKKLIREISDVKLSVLEPRVPAGAD